MKMVILIVKDQLTETLNTALTGAQYRVTRIASTGGFLRSGTTTMLVGVEDAQVESAVSLIRSTTASVEAGEGPHVTLFVVPVSRYEQV
ncbi:MAG TPA: cyclic-di-AMP receptor [Anaerolineales bacterium]